ncbi:glycerol kinase GlpK [Chitinophaga nivalis]|uniref:Glycerol kinase n=1 Tax=Chitinophaga nivalis TaxID=2991709 RepID=A0ABT3IF65_9BACT|nr:glycerol kinase GlpK [Chitinophaga nivalis]MCW3467709.1 glycerol kinase GlpK [Chitinophaga nivalis]MCW3482599.1 glycerol kinase GlpK [Chitinophaga nivalis]
MDKYILSLDQGTTSSRAIIFDHQGSIKAVAQKEFKQIFPKPGWVEHDAMEIWTSQASVAAEVILKARLTGQDIAAIGITNQRETTIVWDRKTGKPIHHAIVWQDRRTAAYCDELIKAGKEQLIRDKTGLRIDAYFSATKIKWMLDNVPGAREKANNGELAFGTVDSWLAWNFSNGQLHITDVSNASRTLLFNIHDMQWDNDLLSLFDIPASLLPAVKPSSEVYGYSEAILTPYRIPIAGIAGDQQAALFGQLCTEPGMIKNTYGTGCFMVLNTGDKPVPSKNNLLTTVAWQINGKTSYALEGSIFIGGAVVQWLRDGLGIIRHSADVEKLAATVPDSDGVYLVPAFAGLGAPYWNQHARGTMVGLTRGSSAAHIARAALDSIAFQTMDVLKALEADAGMPIRELRVDGGATKNNLLMQFQADILQAQVIRPVITETTALGAAYLAGLAVGFWDSIDTIAQQWKIDASFDPGMEEATRQRLCGDWKRAIKAAQAWTEA